MLEMVTDSAALHEWRHGVVGQLAFVPTMGALHAGHMALIDEAKRRADHVAVSIFVNPLQFGEGEDLSRYPRPLDQDRALLSEAGVSLLFAPTYEEMYPPGFATRVQVEAMEGMLCGAHRPGHFTGVTTVVALLLSLMRPDIALFGEKDYQQLAIIRRLNADLRLVPEIVGVPIVRESDGLAYSSRNRYLSPQQREVAHTLYETLCMIHQQAETQPLPQAIEAGRSAILTAGFDRVEYLEARDNESLALRDTPQGARLFVAVWLGTTRLIDNLALDKTDQ